MRDEAGTTSMARLTRVRLPCVHVTRTSGLWALTGSNRRPLPCKGIAAEDCITLAGTGNRAESVDMQGGSQCAALGIASRRYVAFRSVSRTRGGPEVAESTVRRIRGGSDTVGTDGGCLPSPSFPLLDHGLCKVVCAAHNQVHIVTRHCRVGGLFVGSDPLSVPNSKSTLTRSGSDVGYQRTGCWPAS